MNNTIPVASKGHLGVLGSFAVFSLLVAPCFADNPLGLGDSLVGPGAPFGTPYSMNFSSFLLENNYVALTSLTSTYTQSAGSLTGAVTSTVYQDQAPSSPDYGMLGFSYVFTETNPSSDISAAHIGESTAPYPWLPFNITDAGADGSSIAGSLSPSSLTRDPRTGGLTVEFSPVLESTYPSSAVVFFATNATEYSTTIVELNDSGAISDAIALAPAAVPEPPGILCWLGLACTGLACGLWTKGRR